MPYRYVPQKQDYTDFASGRVFYALPGHPAFPVRLASEVFQRCLALRAAAGFSGPCLLYDPCCGGAYHLAALSYLHAESLTAVAASDIDPQAISLAKRNLSLLTLDGLDRRIAEIERMEAAYGKSSHAAALQSARRLRAHLERLISRKSIETHLFTADAIDPQALRRGLEDRWVEVVIADIPYGHLTSWQVTAAPMLPASLSLVGQMLEALLGVLAPQAAVAVASGKDQKIAHPAYRQVGKLRLGKRQVVFFLTED